MRVGLALPQYDYSIADSGHIEWPIVRDWGQRAEELGFDSIWLSDHIFLDLEKYGGTDEVQTAMECFSTLASLAVTTSRVRLGSLVACNDLRSPSLVAKMASTIQTISSGRFELGLGAGWFEREYIAAGISFDSPSARIGRLEEAVRIVTTMLGDSPSSFSGDHYSVENAINLPIGPSPVPVWVGGKGDRVVGVSGKWADGYNAVWAWTPEDFAGRIRVLNHAAEKAGRDPESIRKSVGLYTLVGRDEEQVQRRFDAYMRLNPIGDSLDLASWRKDKLVGTPDEITARIGQFAEIGVEEVILGFGSLPFQIADSEAVEEFAEEVLPLIQGD